MPVTQPAQSSCRSARGPGRGSDSSVAVAGIYESARPVKRFFSFRSQFFSDFSLTLTHLSPTSIEVSSILPETSCLVPARLRRATSKLGLCRSRNQPRVHVGQREAPDAVPTPRSLSPAYMKAPAPSRGFFLFGASFFLIFH